MVQKMAQQLIAVSILLSLTATILAEEDSVVNLSTTVTGNQEQPTVLYIVPWQPADDTTILYQPINSRLSNLFGHVERPEHRRQVEFLEQIVEQSE